MISNIVEFVSEHRQKSDLCCYLPPHEESEPDTSQDKKASLTSVLRELWLIQLTSFEPQADIGSRTIISLPLLVALSLFIYFCPVVSFISSLPSITHSLLTSNNPLNLPHSPSLMAL